MKKTVKYFVALLLELALTFSAFALPAFAAEADSNDTTGTISLKYIHEGTALEGVSVELFYAAELEPDNRYSLSGSFKQYSVDLNNMASQTQWTQCANTLYAYASSDSIAPDSSAKTDPSGSAVFDDLKRGLYLITSQNITVDGAVYSFSPLLLSISAMGEDGNSEFELEANPKSEVSYPPNDEIQYKVIKLWNDYGCETDRPDSITVDIIKDGKSVTKQTLSSSNNWTYKWNSKDDGSLWQVAERDVPAPYIVSVAESDNTFTLTNTAMHENTDSPYPVQTGEPGGGFILLVLILGLCLLVLGFLRLRKERADEKN